MLVLGIETTTKTGSVALVDYRVPEGVILCEMIHSVEAQHSEKLMPSIDHLFELTKVKPEEIDLIAVSQGPGSFTGIRIGLSAGQGLAAGLKKPLVGVSSLEVLSASVLGWPGTVVPVINAFRGEVYASIDHQDGVFSPASLQEKLKNSPKPLFLLGSGSSLMRDFIDQEDVISEEPYVHQPRASIVASIGLRAFKKKGEVPLTIPYLRHPG